MIVNHEPWMLKSCFMKFKFMILKTQYFFVSSWYIFFAFFQSSSHVLLNVSEGEAARRPWIDPDDILDYYFARWAMPVAIRSGTSKRRAGPPSTPVVVDGCLNPRKKGNMQTIQHELTPPQHSQPHPQPLKTTALVYASTQDICYV